MIASLRAVVPASLGAYPPLLALRRREVMERMFVLMTTGEMSGLITARPRVSLGTLPFLV